MGGAIHKMDPYIGGFVHKKDPYSIGNFVHKKDPYSIVISLHKKDPYSIGFYIKYIDTNPLVTTLLYMNCKKNQLLVGEENYKAPSHGWFTKGDDCSMHTSLSP